MKAEIVANEIVQQGLASLPESPYGAITCEEGSASTPSALYRIKSVPIWHTFVDGHQGDYFCRVIEDCVAGSSPEAHEAALRAMEYLQTGARRSLDEVLAAMDGYGAMRAA